MTEASPGFPLHRLNTPLTKIWLLRGAVQRTLAIALVRNHYRGGVGICAANMDLIATVDPTGRVRELPPPFRRYELWQTANAPPPGAGCPCAEFFDPEVGGAHRERGSNEHHPFCQFEREAKRTFTQAQGRAAERIGIPIEHGVPTMGPDVKLKNVLTAQARPDEWQRIRQEYRGR